MADEADDAQVLNEMYLDRALKDNKAKREQPPADFDGENCTDCGEPIEPARIKINAFRCADCQQYKDRVDRKRAIEGRE